MATRVFFLHAGHSEGSVDEVLDVVFVDGDEEHDNGTCKHPQALQEHLACHATRVATTVH